MNPIRKTLPLLVAATMIFFPFTAWAQIMSADLDSLRCGDHLVRLGETSLQVFHQCGPPDDGYSHPEESGGLEKWTYNMGPYDFIYVFTFFNGELHLIKRTDRGF